MQFLDYWIVDEESASAYSELLGFARITLDFKYPPFEQACGACYKLFAYL